MAFIGAGLSLPYYPGWNALVERICVACKVDPAVATTTPGDSRLELMERAQRLAEKDYTRCLHEIFARQRVTPNRYHALARIPFKSFLTTNFDSFLVQALQFSGTSRYSVYPALRVEDHGKGEAFYIHGKIDPADTETVPRLVFTAGEFKTAYTGVLLPSFLQQTFIYNDVCFIGCSLSDEYMQTIFQQCHHARQGLGSLNDPEGPKWFALVDHNEQVPEGFDRFGIELVRYDKLNSDYDGLEEILSSWGNVLESLPRRPFERTGRVFDAGQEIPK